ncbi:MAG: 1-deoxy-D-xylulose-5-phosphate reductoisomerase [Planctomycetaceae bacterium]|jgi:1-deoxy-D-xylulose-5-phosphate reductoisomerase|nr:1-deoxy-D-xylulose-5-phosphate reductoisomerase [Planctomycetaceae bacterium]
MSSFALRRLAVLGSTGSIGRSTLDVVRSAEKRMQVVALSAHTNISLLTEQIQEFRPQIVVVTHDPQNVSQLEKTRQIAKESGTKILFGAESLTQIVIRDDVDIVVSAIVGSAGLKSTLDALTVGKTVALANKESLVVGGELVMDTAKKYGGKIIPIDSEHSAVWQCLRTRTNQVTENEQNTKNIQKIILTASGGPFRNFSSEQLKHVTVADALTHPTWQMGKKITVDSATLINKALEIIEARWLFGVLPSQIAVVIHPQSVIHSMVEFSDGSVMAQLSPPDMRLPIQWAIDYPQQFSCPSKKMNWTENFSLEFFPPNLEQFPALQIGLEVAEQGGTAGAVLNAANEVAVDAFLQEQLPFHKITTVCQTILNHHNYERRPTLEQLQAADHWAREETKTWLSR